MSRLDGIVDCLRHFPNEFQRELQLMGALDIRATKLAYATEMFQKQLLQRASVTNESSAHASASTRTRRVEGGDGSSIEADLSRLRSMHQNLLDLHEEKRLISLKVKEMVIARMALLEEDITATATVVSAVIPSRAKARAAKPQKLQQKNDTDHDDEEDDDVEDGEADHEEEDEDEDDGEDEEGEGEEERSDEKDTDFTPPKSALKKHENIRPSVAEVKSRTSHTHQRRIPFTPVARSSSQNSPHTPKAHKRANGPKRKSASKKPDENMDIETSLLCTCKTIAYGDMVECSNAACIYKWFHMGCVGLNAVPHGPWKCKACTT